jgi:hypothetical protein
MNRASATIPICLQLGLKQKLFFHFREKAKISYNSLTFREISFPENFRFRESFCENFLYRKSFRERFLVFAKIFHQCLVSGYTFRWLLNPDPHSEWKMFAKIFAKIFRNFSLDFFREKRKQIFAKLSRTHENENPSYSLVLKNIGS